MNIGIYNLHMAAMGGGEKLSLVLAEHLTSSHNVWLFCAEPLDVVWLEKFFDVDLSRVKVIPLTAPAPLSRFAGRMRGTSGAVFSNHYYLQLRQFSLDLFVNNSYGSELLCPVANGIFMCMFPHSSSPGLSNVIDSYSTVVAISQYSADWVRQRWDRSAEVIYPPCDDMGPPAAKEKMILHVGRFIADSNQDERHHKRQDLLLETFKGMTDLHAQGWQLHFIGSAGADDRSRTFAGALRRNVQGAPVFFHINSSWKEMRELYRKAAIYWHATGYGVDADTYPSKHEHFGISTVEAMSAAAVPVVYASGGQKEIVTDDVDGCWWNSIDELASQTRRLVRDPALRSRLGDQAVISSKRFSRKAFAARIDNLLF